MEACDFGKDWAVAGVIARISADKIMHCLELLLALPLQSTVESPNISLRFLGCSESIKIAAPRHRLCKCLVRSIPPIVVAAIASKYGVNNRALICLPSSLVVSTTGEGIDPSCMCLVLQSN